MTTQLSAVENAPHTAAARLFGTSGASKMEKAVINRWFAEKCDARERLDYPLTRESVVVDVGGYEGNWAAQIIERHGCTVHIFEPVPAFAAKIRARFRADPRVTVHTLGLAERTGRQTIHIDQDATSIHKAGGTPVEIELHSAREMFSALNLRHVDLMKMNIEGCEYELLAHLIDTGLVARIRDIQVQFHDFVSDAATRMEALQRRLGQTHTLTWQYRFVWENWSREDQP